jgi:hypothetical protein
MTAPIPDDTTRWIEIPAALSPRPLVALCVRDWTAPRGHGGNSYLCRIGYVNPPRRDPIDIYHPAPTPE